VHAHHAFVLGAGLDMQPQDRAVATGVEKPERLVTVTVISAATVAAGLAGH
jgi:hypothetical protein